MPGFRCEKCREHTYVLINGECPECRTSEARVTELVLVVVMLGIMVLFLAS